MAKIIGCVSCGHPIEIIGFKEAHSKIRCGYCKEVNPIAQPPRPLKELVRYSGIRLNRKFENEKLK